jgi:tRNA threonylcarbamoyladenosine biosynthesis protein TsaB
MKAPLMLALDAATYTGTVALVQGSRIVAEREIAMRGEKEERLMPAVEQLLKDAALEPANLERVACGGGPGSFTSLRIAASIAKGIAAGRAIPLFTASSLLLMVAGSEAAGAPGRYLAVLDALRGDAYVAGYQVATPGERDSGSPELLEIAPTALLQYDGVAALARSLGARRIGPREEIAAIPRAAGFARLATWLELRDPVEIAAWEPDYGRLAEAQVRWEREHGRSLVNG